MAWIESRRNTLVNQIYFHLPLLRACLLSRLLIYIKLALVYSILGTIQDTLPKGKTHKMRLIGPGRSKVPLARQPVALVSKVEYDFTPVENARISMCARYKVYNSVLKDIQNKCRHG